MARIDHDRGPVILAKPRTFMNRSGLAAAALCSAHGVFPSELLVVYDDADLPLGKIRLRRGGGSGGHNGISSLVEALGTHEFPRVRLGVRGAGREGQELAEYVLETFAAGELRRVEALTDLAAETVRAAIDGGLERAMNEFNGREADSRVAVAGDSEP